MKVSATPNNSMIGHNRNRRSPYTYAIALDLDTEQLRQLYPNANWNNAYFDIRRELETRGFRWQQGSVYFGNDDIRSTDCVKATMDLDALFPWFKPSVRDFECCKSPRKTRSWISSVMKPGVPPATASAECPDPTAPPCRDRKT